MKVNIYETVEVSDEARKRIASHLGQKTASRDELKAFIWEHGKNWESFLNGDTQPAAEEEDLLGTADDGRHLRLVEGEEFSVDEANVNGVGDDGEDLLGGDDEDLI